METALDFEKPILQLEQKILELKSLSGDTALPISLDCADEIRSLEARRQKLIASIFERLSPWQRVQLSRHPSRPYAMDYIPKLVDQFTELHGDRHFGDDPTVVSGFGFLEGRSVALVGLQKGRTTKEKVLRNFGMAKPEGYRKALRIAQLASRFRVPVITLIDTPGAYPGVEAEERGQAEAIARCLLDMLSIQSPSVAIVIGEGGSGGALALGVADRVLMLQYATYSVISPESCASILWSDSTQAETASKLLKLSAPDALAQGVIDGIIEEPLGGAHRDPDATAASIKQAILAALSDLSPLPSEVLVEQRHLKFRQMGQHAVHVPKTTPSQGDSPSL